MPEQHLITIGYIPRACMSSRIQCGDASSSGTTEVTFSLDTDAATIECLETGDSKKCTRTKWFDTKDPIWKWMAVTCVGKLVRESKLAPAALGKCWGVFMQETAPSKDMSIVERNEDGGECLNAKRKYNGRFFIRYQLDDSGEYLNELVIVLG